MAKNNRKLYNIKVDGIIGYHANAEDIAKQLEMAKDGDIEVTFSSPGGFVLSGVKIFNLFRNFKGYKTAILDNLAASMSSYIPMAFDKIKAYDNTSFMIHNAQIGAGGDHNELRKKADIAEGMSKMLANQYVQRTGKSPSEIHKMMDAETWLFGQEIVDSGFADEIIHAKEKKNKKSAIAEASIAWEECKAIINKEEKTDIDQMAALINIEPENNIILIFEHDGQVFNVTQEEYDNAEAIDPEAPYPNEHACRVRQPGEFQAGSFRRISRESNGKKFDIIIGRLKGQTPTTTQAFRYPKDTWKPADAREYCQRNQGKTFEPASGCHDCEDKSTHNNNENPAQAGENNRRFTNMSLKQLLEENPTAKAEYEQEIAAAEGRGAEKAHATFTALEPYFTGESTYPKSVMEHAFTALKGEQSKDVFLGAVAAYDAAKEAMNSGAAAGETDENQETPSEQPAQGGPAASADDIKALAEADEQGAR